jgi:DNA-directed RNA polymerase subunit RPC12/RpoP
MCGLAQTALAKESYNRLTVYALNPGTWYLRYTCEGCKSQQVLFADLSNGKSEINATYGAACSDCGHKGSYESEHLERYQHPAASSQAA